MYNRYINSGGFSDYFKPIESENVPPAQADYIPPADTGIPSKKPSIFDNIKNMFGGGVSENGEKSGFTFDMDTIFLLVLVYFLIADGEDNMTETLLIVGALLLLGF